ncbi:unnamed protein product [Adineta steineri]|uniref:Protein kinase domain-containing protein n=1 Tax=Adineta steineri TaxID=433720 RepID=A0A815LNJ5_9BILA|nr:unnamed protein product [Adineta steineri]CAF1406605.1 unnamed protein product [Adineta steineri]CAF1423193.1 unnamed protein product [Adineta steineri]CAF3621365.1 unnamed protein product [Adineta steineri]CAF3622976.1 unnamed protein product [Adineta steineri]
MEKYRILGKKGEGTFSEVLKCQNVRDGTFWAAKKMKQLYKSMDEIQQIREIRVLKQLNGHPNIIFLREIVFDKRSGVLCLIFELMNLNLYEYIRGRQRLLSNETVCKFMYQLLKALEYLHRHTFFHRDVKPENILIKDDILKLADFGSCRQTLSKQPFTEYISTRWYRAPECLLTDGYYRNQMDIWSAGCVMYEIITLKPLFPGSNELDQISKIHDVLGTPSSSILDKFQHRNSAVDFNFPPRSGTGIARHLTQSSPTTIDLINQLCIYDPDRRISAVQALRHTYFDSVRTPENTQLQEQNNNNQLENGVRLVKTSEDQYERSDSSSDVSNAPEENVSPRSNVHISPSLHQQPALKSDHHRLIYVPGKTQSLIDTGIQGQSIKKSTKPYPINNNNNTKMKYTHSHPSQLRANQAQTFYSSLSALGTIGSPYKTQTNRKTTKNGPTPFLPSVSGASAFSNYSNTSGHSSSIVNKTHYPGKNLVGYYPIMSYRPYKK